MKIYQNQFSSPTLLVTKREAKMLLKKVIGEGSQIISLSSLLNYGVYFDRYVEWRIKTDATLEKICGKTSNEAHMFCMFYCHEKEFNLRHMNKILNKQIKYLRQMRNYIYNYN